MSLTSSDHILVTGGTGFIGQPLCAQLLAMECRVTVLTRNLARGRKLLAPAPTLGLIADLQDLDGLPAVSAVVNLAGEPLATRRWSAARKELFYASRVGMTERLFEYFSGAGRSPPTVLINGSAIGYYGAHGDEVLDENGAITPCFASDLCRAWEKAACQFESLGVRVCRLRTGIVLGEGGALAAMLPAFKLGLGGTMGSGRQWMSWIHRDDMVAAIAFCLSGDHLAGAFNATAPTPVTNREFAKILAATLSRPCLLPMPAFAMRLMLGEMADELLLSGQKVIPARLQEAGFQFSYSNLPQALAQILA